MMNSSTCDKEKTIDVFLKVFISLETFLQKATTLNIFESLIFNYKIKVNSVDECSSQFTSFVAELCNDLELTLQESRINNGEPSEATTQTPQVDYQEFQNVSEDLEYAIPLSVNPGFSNTEQNDIHYQNDSNKSNNIDCECPREERPCSPLSDGQKSVYTCDYCNRKYTTIGNLTKHMCKSAPLNESLDEELLDDPEFNAAEESTTDQTLHLPESDPQASVFVCAFCFTTYSQREQFDQHNHGFNPQPVVLLSDVEQLRSQRKFSCGVCHEVYRSLARITYHVTRCQAGPYHCELCTHVAASKQLLNSHKKKQHKGVESFFCTECGLGFKLRTSLQKHQVNRHENEQSHFVCDFDNCNLIFTKKIQLTNHKIEAHKIEKKFLCQVCGHKFMTQESLSSHLETHTNKRKFECQLCGKPFSAKEKMIFHIRTHTGEKPFVCPQCNKSFISKAKLKEHLLRHAGEKRHKCAECGKQYANKTDLKSHFRKKHIIDEGVTEGHVTEVPALDQTQPAELYSSPAHLFNNLQFCPTEPVQLCEVRTINVGPPSVVITSYETLVGM